MLSWDESTVEVKLSRLDSDLRAQGSVAFAWLKAHNPAYNLYVVKQMTVLTTGCERKLLPSQLTEPFLESALWPHLYPFQSWCESEGVSPENWSPFSAEVNVSVAKYMSVKALFVRNLLGPIPDFAVDYSLLQFNFDRYLLHIVRQRALVALAGGYDPSLALRDKHWCPHFWASHHSVLIDVVRQHGVPALFLTVSPWELSFPWPLWVRRIHSTMGRDPTEAPGPEAFAVAHALHQLVGGFLCGHTSKESWTQSHWFGDKAGGKENPVRAYFGRFEFQDGGASHEYGKGRGSIHLHCLFWFSDIRKVHLENLIQAHVPPVQDPELRQLVLAVQTSEDSDHVPINTGPSAWIWQPHGWGLMLHKSEEFESMKLRAFIPGIMRTLRCHQDIQWSTAGAPLLRYVAGYASKFSEAWSSDWVDEADSPLTASLNVARYWKAAAPEQALVLGRGGMVTTNVDSMEYAPKLFGKPEDSLRRLYCRRPEASEALTFLEWLRAFSLSGAEGQEIAKPRATKHVFAVGIRFARFASPSFFWQWLQVFSKFRSVISLCPGAMWSVSPDLQSLAACLELHPGTWSDRTWVIEYLRIQGHREDYVLLQANRIESLVTMVRLIRTGVVPKFQFTSRVIGTTLNSEQETYWRIVVSQLEIRRSEQATVRPFVSFLTGGPGTGKSTLVSAIIDSALDLDLQVLRCSPTGQLVQQTWNDKVCNRTICSRFGIHGSSWRFQDEIGRFDVWVIGEIGMVPSEHADIIYAHWLRCDKRPVLLFEGDFAQLPPVDETDVRGLPWWSNVKTFELFVCHRSSDQELLSFLSVIRKHRPTEIQLRVLHARCLSVEISEQALLHAWAVLPQAVVLSATIATAELANAVGLQGCMGDSLGTVKVWAGPDKDILRVVGVKRGCKLHITNNLDIDGGLFNGARAVLKDRLVAGLLLELADGCQRVLFRRSSRVNAHFGRTVMHAYDITLGYAQTVHKAQGLTLESVILCLEPWSVPGWGYTALSRIRALQSLAILGSVNQATFQPRL